MPSDDYEHLYLPERLVLEAGRLNRAEQLVQSNGRTLAAGTPDPGLIEMLRDRPQLPDGAFRLTTPVSALRLPGGFFVIPPRQQRHVENPLARLLLHFSHGIVADRGTDQAQFGINHGRFLAPEFRTLG